MSAEPFLNFDLRIEAAEHGYRAHVVNSPAGETSDTFETPFSQPDLENFWQRIGSLQRLSSQEDLRIAQRYGETLFNTVFAKYAFERWRLSLDIARREDVPLRLRLFLDQVPELVDLPWELLYDPPLQQFLALSKQVWIVRFLNLPTTPVTVQVTPPLRILAVIPNPTDLAPVDVEAEWNHLQKGVDAVQAQGKVTLTRLEPATPAALARALRETEYHVLHFVGHSETDWRSRDSLLFFEDEQGDSRSLDAEQLARLLADSSTRFVFLETPAGGRVAGPSAAPAVAQELVRRGMGAALAVQVGLAEEERLLFTRELYTGLARSSPTYPIEAAVAGARQAGYLQTRSPGFGAPILYSRLADGHLFEVGRAPQREAAPQATSSAPASPQLYALLVGIDRYAAPPNVAPPLRGCVNDVQAMYTFLTTRLGIPDENIRMLTASIDGNEAPDQLPTRENILRGWQEHLMQAGPGDQVFFQYSGHGTQVRSMDPNEPDGYDEGIAPHDARTADVPDILDKELASLADQIEEKGAQLTVFLDCSHSGDNLHGGFAEANYVMLAACRENEQAHDYRPESSEQLHGAATYFLLQALADSQPDITWADVYDALMVDVKSLYPQQTPQLIGPGQRRVFGDEGQPLPSYLLVMETIPPGQGEGYEQMASGASALDMGQIRVNGGAAIGLAPGTELHVYPPRHNLQGTPATTATVVSVEVDQALAQLDAVGSVEPGSRVRMGRPSPTSDRLVRVWLDPALTLSQELTYVQWVRSSGEQFDWQVVLQDAELEIWDAAGARLFPETFPNNEDGLARLGQILDHLARYRNILSLQNGGPDAALANTLHMEAATFATLSRDGRPIGEQPIHPGDSIVSGDKVLLTLRNQSQEDLYLTLFYLSPEYGVHRVYPNRTDCRFVAAGAEVRVPMPVALLDSDQEQGRAVFKVFASSRCASFDTLQLPDLDLQTDFDWTRVR